VFIAHAEIAAQILAEQLGVDVGHGIDRRDIAIDA
jgi:hypothetical protein